MWCVPRLDETYLKRMRDLLRLYGRSHNETYPVVCLDEKSVELRDHKRKGWTDRRGARFQDYEYVRRGTANVFVMVSPRGGRHYCRVTHRRDAREFALTLKYLSRRFPRAKRIHLVMDNLNTHREKSLVAIFGTAKGRALWRRFKVHYTPVHASWLNQAEIGISAMVRGCLQSDRVPDIDALRNRVTAFWRVKRQQRWTIDWRFTNRKAKKWLTTFSDRH